MHVTPWYGTSACHTIAWYQCMSHYGTNTCHTIALCQYITLWNEANACHHFKLCTTNCNNIRMSTLYIWHGINAGHTLGHSVTVNNMA